MNRHAALRTSFNLNGADQPIQRVHRHISLPIQELDWRDRAADNRETQLEAFLLEDRELGFHLDQAPLMRMALIRWAQAEYRWIWTSHHTLFDGRSRLLLL